MSNIHQAGRTIAALAAVPLLVGLFVGCSAGEKTEPSPDSAVQTDQQAMEEWELKYNACMKEKGYDLPAPGADRGDGVDIGDDVAAFEADGKACRDKVGQGPAGTVDKKSSDAFLDDILKLNQCLRDRGYDIKDPDPGSKALSAPSNVDPEDMKACQAEIGGGGPSAG